MHFSLSASFTLYLYFQSNKKPLCQTCLGGEGRHNYPYRLHSTRTQAQEPEIPMISGKEVPLLFGLVDLPLRCD